MASMTAARNLPGGSRASDDLPLSQSRETGGIITESSHAVPRVKGGKNEPAARSWAHMVAGGIGGMTAAAVTAPLDVLKTRLQSDFYQSQLRASRAAHAAAMNPIRAAGYHFSETFQILTSVYRIEGPRALFKGLGPNLIGVVPARSIQFYTYGNSKRLIADHLNGGNSEAWWVHLTAAVTAGVTTSTATNPIWMVKTRLQLDKEVSKESGGLAKRQYKNSWDCIKQIIKNEGIRGLYKGMSASYLGVSEITMHWVVYEQLKRSLAKREEELHLSGRDKTTLDHALEWFGKSGAAGSAKLVAAVVTYPHEVARTRLRQSPMADGKPMYTGLVQCFKLVFKQEGLAGLYGGMTPHLLRTVPSAAIMFGMYEGILRLIGEKA